MVVLQPLAAHGFSARRTTRRGARLGLRELRPA
jgi:hypothetical protein